MQRADDAGSTRGLVASPGNTPDFSTSRRSLLAGAMLAIPLAAVPAVAAQTDGGIWEATLRSWEAARAAAQGEYRRVKSLYPAPMKTPREVSDYLDRLTDAEVDAEDALLQMPAPHGRALLWKIERLLVDEGDGHTAACAMWVVDQTVQDARRLLGAAA